jgi:integrase
MSAQLQRVKNHPGIYKVLDAGGHWTSAYKTSYRVNGRQHWKTFTPPDALKRAQAFRASVATRREDGTLVDPNRGLVTLQTVYDELHATRCYAHATLEMHMECWKYIRPVLGHQSVGRIETSAVDALLHKLNDRPAMAAKVRSLLSVLFNRALANKLIASSPMPRGSGSSTRAERKARGKNGKPKRILSDEELLRLLEETDPRYRAALVLMAREGLRPGEAIVLTVGKFTPPGGDMPGRLSVDTALSGDTKTGESRELILPDAVSAILADHISRFCNGRPDAPLFTTDHGQPITTKNAFDAWRRRQFVPASVRAGINQGLSPNDLRHTAAAWAISLGGTVYDVQRLLGHAKPSITLDIYGSLWEAKHADLVRRQNVALREFASLDALTSRTE